LFLVTPNFETHGLWAIALASLLVFDVGISIADFALERRSRANLGGLPSGEYVLHMLMAILFGAFVALLAPNLIAWARSDTAVVASEALAVGCVRIILGLFAFCVLISGFLDAVAAAQLTRKTRDRTTAKLASRTS
jgi:hypothetical protein